MRDADALISRILLFEGHPNVQRLNPIRIGEDAEEMLRIALESEIAAVAQFNSSAQESHDLGDHASAAIFEEMARDEEKHADWFEVADRGDHAHRPAAVPLAADGDHDPLTSVGSVTAPRERSGQPGPGRSSPAGSARWRSSACWISPAWAPSTIRWSAVATSTQVGRATTSVPTTTGRSRTAPMAR